MKICITSDIHFERVLLEEKGYENMLTYFKETLEYVKPDVFIIAGDLTDSRNLRFETPEASKLIEFVKEILDITSKFNIEVIVLKGTPSHDGDIVKNLSFITDKYKNFTHIEDMKKMYLHGLKFVFIPELYRPSINIFEKELSELVTPEHPVDIIVYHGMMDFAIPAVKQIDSKHNLSRSVVMNSSKMSKLASLIIGGHVHSFIKERNIYYTGRFINERGHSHMNDVYGIKYVEYNDRKFRIQNIENPYIITQKVIQIDLTKYSYDDEQIRKLMDIDKNDAIFEVIMSKKDGTKFKSWKSAYNPLYIKRIIVDKHNKEDNSNDTKVGLVTLTDIKSLLVDIYKDKFDEKLSEDVVSMIELGDDYDV